MIQKWTVNLNNFRFQFPSQGLIENRILCSAMVCVTYNQLEFYMYIAKNMSPAAGYI